MEIRVEGRGPVVRPRRTWLESAEADMAELQIDRDVHDRKKRGKNVMKRKSKPIGKTDYKPIINNTKSHYNVYCHRQWRSHG